MGVSTRRESRQARHLRVRKKVEGTTAKPRLCVFRSNQHIYAQVIDDSSSKGSVVITQAGTLEAGVKGDVGGKGYNVEAAKAVGKLVAERAQEKGITTVVFDRAGYLYHGRVAALAAAAREAGLQF